MQTEHTEAVLEDDNFVSCVLPPLPLPAACRGPAGWVGDWVGKKSCVGQDLVLCPHCCHMLTTESAAFAEERGAWFPSSSGAPARVAAASLVSTGAVGQEMHCAGHLPLLLPLWLCCWDSWVPPGDQCGGPARALGERAWPRWCEQSGIPLSYCLSLEKILGHRVWDAPLVGAGTREMQLPWHSSKPGSSPQVSPCGPVPLLASLSYPLHRLSWLGVRFAFSFVDSSNFFFLETAVEARYQFSYKLLSETAWQPLESLMFCLWVEAFLLCCIQSLFSNFTL